MICMNCGKHVDDDVRVCPFCGSELEAAAPQGAEPAPEEDPLSIFARERKPIHEDEPAAFRREPEPDFDAERPAPRIPLLALIPSILALILGVMCLVMLFSLRGDIRALADSQADGASGVKASLSAVESRLDALDATLATVQSEAYEQVASQSISITKDITPLTGPVDEGKYNQMFIVKAKGNLNVDTAFDWQRYNEATGGWVSIVFTGDATTNEQFGLRLENQFNAAEQEYTTILWAQGITQEAAGTYRCVITDNGGITKTSAEAVVSIQAVE